ncbi:SIS domain-containing protein [Polynucleobacter sp. 86C-FISCH]|uniref:SIS domain-containing protein n=1 Tax=Polynucleobacter sp. 86C-FISCH TaxID=2689101 RepID=UPI001C0C0F65|nr:SIS domain-containing protein [Polynucleobacter sp. 86C-FISCH]MBU3596011.1 SIS domain-containing protein [Polynucleobacter sp. 86C-FISCH]
MISNNSARYVGKLTKILGELNFEDLDAALKLIEEAWRNGRQIITLGNGGSSLTALHFINDWNKSIYMSTGVSFKGRSLVDNIGLIMSYGNDISFEDVFLEQLKNILTPGDLVIAISGSGNSENVIRAVNYANENGAKTLGLCGFSGGRLKTIAQQKVWVNVDDMQLVEDVHAIFGHIVMQTLCG